MYTLYLDGTRRRQTQEFVGFEGSRAAGVVDYICPRTPFGGGLPATEVVSDITYARMHFEYNLFFMCFYADCRFLAPPRSWHRASRLVYVVHFRRLGLWRYFIVFPLLQTTWMNEDSLGDRGTAVILGLEDHSYLLEKTLPRCR